MRVAPTEHRRYDGHHEVFRALPDSAVLWRYMDLTKLMALLEDRALHFARSDLLGDPFEGSMTAPMTETPVFAMDADKGQPVELDDNVREMLKGAGLTTDRFARHYAGGLG